MKHIGKMKQLVSLDISDSVAVTSGCLQHLTQLKNLTHLTMENVEITNKDLSHLSALTSLLSLELSNCKLDDGSAFELAKLNTLHNLDIGGSNITDKGLATLTKLKHLNHLSAKACQNISKSAIENYSRQFPNCKVAYVSGAKFREKLKK
jgi:Leucine-rich repeat (LRR) protein